MAETDWPPDVGEGRARKKGLMKSAKRLLKNPRTWRYAVMGLDVCFKLVRLALKVAELFG